MTGDFYAPLRTRASEIAASQGTPSFYRVFKRELRESLRRLQEHVILKQCVSHIGVVQEGMGHGYKHSRAVAVDAGALVMIEGRRMAISEDIIEKLIISAHISGLLHDIKRGNENHAVAGSEEARRILVCSGIDSRFKRYIAVAIRNHEAFKAVVPPEDEYGELISNVLYDADKFRWGQENFTKTVWDMLEFGNIAPEVFLENYRKGIEYIKRIKETFRTKTGKRYGPEIIDMGLEIGKIIYSELKEILGR
ncbi:hypothetical protein MNBD_NITROSPIRAE03-579 [hydrothermal vent metagenome]|uniref:HD domain-containing protein n=1 Tax=hydrothermal vent metagenome TaxID=652676 RepID=A0A3B1CVZ7_9ZZZZ